jgi:hypothetical protein
MVFHVTVLFLFSFLYAGHLDFINFPYWAEFWKEEAETDCWDMATITLEKSQIINDDICYCSTFITLEKAELSVMTFVTVLLVYSMAHLF